MIQFLDLIAAILVRGLSRICYFLPASIVLKAGRSLGRLIFFFNTDRRCIGYANLRAAFCGSKTPLELKKMTVLVYKNLTETFSEILCLSKVDEKYIDRYVKIENPEYMFQSVKKGKGIIFLTAHFGNWELSGIVSSLKGYPLYVLARDQKMKRMNELINSLRESKGLKVVRKGITTKYIVRALHEGKIIGMVADQNGGPNGILANFFGRSASTTYGTYRFAAKTGAVIIPVFIARIKGPYHRLVLEHPIEIKDGEELLPYIQRYNDLLQLYVTKYYDQWLWLHRRWKSCPVKKIVVLSDGKKGHLNQSLSLAESFVKYRLAKGISRENSPIEVIDVHYRSKIAKAVVNICGFISGSRCQGCLRCLKFALEASSYNRLIKTYADVVISTGFSLAAVNSIYTRENNAKNAVCMRPGFTGYVKFDMAVVPRHDVPKPMRDKKIVVTDISPNLIDESYLDKGKEALSREIKKENGITIGVLLGGDSSDFRYEKDDIVKVISQILDASNRLKADILFTTSRRTPKSIEEAVKERLASEPMCKLLVIASENNTPYAVSGILGLSDILLVSGESTSMVSEAVSSGKRTVVFKGRKVRKLTNKPAKHEIFLNRLRQTGDLRISGPERIADTICEALKSEPPRKKLPKDDLIYMNMWRLGA